MKIGVLFVEYCSKIEFSHFDVIRNSLYDSFNSIVEREKSMFIRERKRPKVLRKLDAIISRLPPTHAKLPILRNKAARYQKGYNGERKLDYHLQGMPSEFSVLNDVTLSLLKKQVQIDSINITPHAIYIIEVKSLEGTVTFDTNLKQLIQENGEKIDGYKYPIVQAEMAQFHLQRWLQERNLSGLPIYYFIAFSERSTIININGDDDTVRKVVSYVDEIPLRLMQHDQQITEINRSNKELKNKIIHALIKECVDFDYDVLAKFGIKKSEILPGVHCPDCGVLGMVRIHGKWHCPKCGNYSITAHKKAFDHYTLLNNSYITNQQCREFLKVSCRHQVKQIFKSSNIKLIKGTQKWQL